jgi:PadR family transcriptional regulator, regulatory protein PadR
MPIPTHLVLRALPANPAEPMYGLQICAQAGLPSGTVHPILAPLEGLGWLESNWEDHQRIPGRRPGRRYYWLCDDVANRAHIALTQATISASTLDLRVQSAGGIP